MKRAASLEELVALGARSPVDRGDGLLDRQQRLEQQLARAVSPPT